MNVSEKLEHLKSYFTGQGFTVRDGLRYGVDFLLYTDDVEKVHSRYAVILNRNFTFLQILAIQRTCNSSRKECILADFFGDKIRLIKIERFIHEYTNK
ncbi:tRNA-splicing endonuclease subunit Sen2 [Gurleya vavrai]